MTSKTIFIMKQTMLAAALLLGVGWMLASCGNDNPSVNENPTPVIVEETTLPIEEETVDTLFRTYDEAEYMDRSKDFEHKIDENDYCVKVFTSYGFRWGGRWSSTKDYQHFEK